MAGERGDEGMTYRATIPGDYTASPYALQYSFRIHPTSGRPWLLPGLDENLANRPYFLVPQRPAAGSRS
jgi:hypothetical protein